MCNAPSKWAAMKVGVGEKQAHLYDESEGVEFFETEADAGSWVRAQCAKNTSAVYAILEVKSVVKAKPIVVEAVF